jgi:hypothetical protein
MESNTIHLSRSLVIMLAPFDKTYIHSSNIDHLKMKAASKKYWDRLGEIHEFIEKFHSAWTNTYSHVIDDTGNEIIKDFPCELDELLKIMEDIASEKSDANTPKKLAIIAQNAMPILIHYASKADG